MLEGLLDLVWPRRCEVCGRLSDRPGRHVCADCLNRIPFVPQSGCCRVCGRSVSGQDREFLCEDCRRPSTRPSFDRAASAVRYEDQARDMVHGYKFSQRLWMRPDFSDWLEAACRARFDVDQVDAVLPMPATLFHRIDRGYNQSAYLAADLARRFDRRLLEGILRRKGNPRRQAGLREEERRENAKGTFAVRRPDLVRGRTLLVVDDVMSTGATLSECARALKDAGAWRVWCATLARSVRS